jgi:hypothetical protein
MGGPIAQASSVWHICMPGQEPLFSFWIPKAWVVVQLSPVWPFVFSMFFPLFSMSFFVSYVFLTVLEHSMTCTAVRLYPILNSICTALQPVIHGTGCAPPPSVNLCVTAWTLPWHLLWQLQSCSTPGAYPQDKFSLPASLWSNSGNSGCQDSCIAVVVPPVTTPPIAPTCIVHCAIVSSHFLLPLLFSYPLHHPSFILPYVKDSKPLSYHHQPCWLSCSS